MLIYHFKVKCFKNVFFSKIIFKINYKTLNVRTDFFLYLTLDFQIKSLQLSLVFLEIVLKVICLKINC